MSTNRSPEAAEPARNQRRGKMFSPSSLVSSPAENASGTLIRTVVIIVLTKTIIVIIILIILVKTIIIIIIVRSLLQMQNQN